MKNLFFLSLVASFSSLTLTAQAQGHDPDLAPTPQQKLVEDIGPDRLPNQFMPPTRATDRRNVAELLQMGTGNVATIGQTNNGVLSNQAQIMQVGVTNYLDLAQSGSGNVADLTQRGTANESTVDQRGRANALSSQVIGNHNEFNVMQDGNNNSVVSQLVLDNHRYNVKQTGNNNSLTQLENTSSGPGYNVLMTGNMHVTIQQGHVQ